MNRERDVTRRDKIESVKRLSLYRPRFTIFIVVFSFLAAFLEGIGLTFLLPVIEIAQGGEQAAAEADGLLEIFVDGFALLGLSLALEWILLGLILIMTVRYSASLLLKWLSSKLGNEYKRDLQTRAFDAALDTRISYYDQEGSDELINALITQASKGANLITKIVSFFEQILISAMYFAIALIIAPILTIITVILLTTLAFVTRWGVVPGYELGNRIANANENIQKNIQAGTQGIRDIKLFNMREEVFENFRSAVKERTEVSVYKDINTGILQYSYEWVVVIILSGLIYVALAILNLSLAELGLFLFAMFRLAPRASNLNSKFYSIEGQLPHLVRTHWYIDEMNENTEQTGGSEPAPNRIKRLAFDHVTFSYETADEIVLDDVTFDVDRGEFIGLVGQSGAGKSTVVSLISRMYEPDEGRILANNTPIHEFPIDEWREQVAMVRQKPFIFNETLRYNLTIGNREATQTEIERVAEIAQITEFLDELPDGYDSQLGDEGVQLSGGQRQRVALARALLRDAEILILDEATSDLDSNLELQVHRAIEELDEEYTIIAIAHQLSTVRHADRIYTLESGRITESGTHEDLVKNNGKYAELYAIQS